MNRQTILSSIDRQLRESFAKTGEVRPLGEIVPLVAAELRPPKNGSYANPSVIPIEQVAAFIDGHLSEDETKRLCDAVLFDNSVLAELIAGVRSKQEYQELAPISDALTDRLLAMQPQAAASRIANVLPGQLASDVSETDASAAARSIQPATLTEQPRPTKRSRMARVVAILAIAATLLALVFVMSRRRNRTPQGNEIVEQDDVAPNTVTDIPNIEPPSQRAPHENNPIVATEPDPRLDPDPTPRPLDPASVVRDAPEPSPQREPMDVVPKIPLDPSPPRDSGPSVARLANLRWTEITGLLTELNEADGSTGPARAPTWKSVQTDTEPADDSPVKNAVALRTLPLSRAEATLATGGRIVLAGDSGVHITRTRTESSAAIELDHGSVAMMDLPAGTVIDLRMADRIVATLRWQEQASAVLQRASAGLQIQIDRGTIDVNDQPHSDDAIVVAVDQSIQSIDKPKRIPAWVDRPVENINVPRPFLAQLAQSKNVTETLNERINALASQPTLSTSESRTLTTLANWQVSMAGPNLMRLGNNRHAVMRMAALNRLVNLRNDDPRYGRVWHAIERATNNPQRAAQLRRWCSMARDGVRPNAIQVEQLLNGLTARDVSARALCDFLLRTFYGGGPHFDPTWTGQAQIRGVRLWRTYTGKSATGAANQVNPGQVNPNRPIRDVP